MRKINKATGSYKVDADNFQNLKDQILENATECINKCEMKNHFSMKDQLIWLREHLAERKRNE
jgi:hypothetical protein